MAFDGHLELSDSLFVDSDLAEGVVVSGLHLVEFVFPHVAFLVDLSVLGFPHGALSLNFMEFGFDVKESVVLLQKGVVLDVQLLEVVSGLLESVLSHGILISVHIGELLSFLELSPQSLDFDVKIFVGLFKIEAFLLPHDDFLREGIFLVNVHRDGSFEFVDSNLELLLHFSDEHLLVDGITVV